jgi:hypothetical protein
VSREVGVMGGMRILTVLKPILDVPLRLAPAEYRDDWRAEWLGELYWIATASSRYPPVRAMRAAAYAIGCVIGASRLRSQTVRQDRARSLIAAVQVGADVVDNVVKWANALVFLLTGGFSGLGFIVVPAVVGGAIGVSRGPICGVIATIIAAVGFPILFLGWGAFIICWASIEERR